MFGTMTILADGGIAAGVMSQGGKVWQNPEKLGIVLATGLDLRRKFAVGSLVIAAPVLFLLLMHHGASWLIATFILLSLIPAFLMALSGTLLEIVPKLHQDIVPLQKIQIMANSGRLAISLILIFLFPLAYVAILAAGLSQVWANFRLREFHKYADAHLKPDPEISKKILAFFKRILPGSVYYCISGQITVWLISILGTTKSVAQIGALGRLAMLLSLVSVLINTLIIPRYSRLPHNKKLLLKRYLQIQAWLLGLSLCIMSLIYLFPDQILWLLGKNYADLKDELLLNIIAGRGLGLMVGTSFSLCTCRGWAMNPFIPIVTSLLAITGGILLIDISTLRGILLLNICIALAELTLYIFYNIRQILKESILPT